MRVNLFLGGKSPSSSSWPDLVPITEDSPFPLLFVTAVWGNKGKTGTLYKTWQAWGTPSETPIPRGPWVHTHHHSDQFPALCCGAGLHWAGPPTLVAALFKTYSRLAWQKKKKERTNITHTWTPAPVSQQLVVKDPSSFLTVVLQLKQTSENLKQQTVVDNFFHFSCIPYKVIYVCVQDMFWLTYIEHVKTE